ncbi:uncharacterized protein EI97DRAFT_295507 [Westerdykella ornata]|uniref:Uncharacterized protein n=1 Tax=Westerdykella ornata TaxID=318751 RepID=A0A6A6JLX8_WESOR|nr:uncharacterized protein EI97DRAFT_295507 [Westerdykella ornata]KAF2277507.1 hypothetical protein EI97DRAFT_295507 [Westerdykella ornata]
MPAIPCRTPEMVSRKLQVCAHGYRRRQSKLSAKLPSIQSQASPSLSNEAESLVRATMATATTSTPRSRDAVRVSPADWRRSRCGNGSSAGITMAVWVSSMCWVRISEFYHMSRLRLPDAGCWRAESYDGMDSEGCPQQMHFASWKLNQTHMLHLVLVERTMLSST